MTDPICPFCGTALSEHPAGRCLDAWISQLRGWEIMPSEKRDADAELVEIDNFYHYISEGDCFEETPRWSTAWAEAGKLLEEMAEARIGAQLSIPGNGCGRWRMEFWQPDGTGDLHLRVFLADAGPLVVAWAHIAWKEGQGE